VADFPSGTLEFKEDSKFRNVTTPDQAIRNEMEGGYAVTRPRYTRSPPKTFVTGFTNITETEKAQIEAFWELKRGGSAAFTWLDRVTNITHIVRFKGDLKFTYAGMGGTHRWTTGEIQLEQV
jgi:hypothetical protein